MSDDGQHAIVVIALLGSVFSPYYAAARRRSDAVDPLNFCALNVVLYGPGRKRWAMTERGRAQVQRTAQSLQLGPSALAWDAGGLSIHIDEVTVPWPSRLRGTVRVAFDATTSRAYVLDGRGRHRWWPIAPRTRVEVMLDRPDLRWHGQGYLDANQGDVPLSNDFERWDWSRAALPSGRTVIAYDVACRGGEARSLALAFDERGATLPLAPSRVIDLPPTRWRVARRARADGHVQPLVVRTLEDTPFYARSLLQTQWLGEPAQAVHESLSLTRFDAPWVQAMLPFRMPRRAGSSMG